MKIHFFANDTTFTGGRLVMFDHANALAASGHSVTIQVPGGGGAVDWMDLRVPIFDLESTGYDGLPAADICLFDRRRFARPLCSAGRGVPVQFCQGFEGVDVDVRLARLVASPAGWLRPNELWNLWRRRHAIESDYALPAVKIVVQQHLHDILARRYHQPVYVVPNGLPPGVFTPGADDVRERTVILVVGPTNVRCKRIADALEAIRLIKIRRPDVRLVRVSPHPMSSAEQQFGVTDEYHVLVPPEELARQYRRAAALLFPSDETEGFGLPMLEAMACGTPVVVSDIAAARAFDARGDHACFVPVGRPDELAEALASLLDDPTRQERLRQRGQEVAAHYTRERSHAAMERALTEIVSIQSRAAG
jgi:glycosyltransferase involved in cell wall biosynthesis